MPIYARVVLVCRVVPAHGRVKKWWGSRPEQIDRTRRRDTKSITRQTGEPRGDRLRHVLDGADVRGSDRSLQGSERELGWRPLRGVFRAIEVSTVNSRGLH